MRQLIKIGHFNLTFLFLTQVKILSLPQDFLSGGISFDIIEERGVMIWRMFFFLLSWKGAVYYFYTWDFCFGEKKKINVMHDYHYTKVKEDKKATQA